MGYEIHTSGEVVITPALPDDFAKHLGSFMRRDLSGETPAIPFPTDAEGWPRTFCDWEIIQVTPVTMLIPDQPAFIGWDDWLAYLITWIKTEFPGTHVFSGTIYWEGDDSDDRGRVIVSPDGTVTAQEQIEAVYKGSPEAEWHEAVGEYFRNQPPTGLGRILTIWTEEDLALKYAEAVCDDCRNGTCELVADEHDLDVYRSLPEETRISLVQRARNALGQSTMTEAAMDTLLSVVEEGGTVGPDKG